MTTPKPAAGTGAKAILSAIGAAMIIALSFGLAMMAFDWGISGLLGVPEEVALVFYALTAVATAWIAVWAFFRTLYVEARVARGQDIDAAHAEYRPWRTSQR